MQNDLFSAIDTRQHTEFGNAGALTHASLFSGIGGFDLAAEWAGWKNLFNCEIDPFCRKVLKYHFPHAKQYEDVRTTDFAVWRGRIDVLTGGFPCQPFSTAGRRKGTDDERYLWPAMLGAIRAIHPRWLVGENVLGIVNWSDGLVFEQVCADLENEGYEVQPYILPACGVDAPHRRERTWFVAKNAECVRRHGDKSEKESEIGKFWQSGAGDNVRICDSKKRASSYSSNTGIKKVREPKNGFLPAETIADADSKLPEWRHDERLQGRKKSSFTTESFDCNRVWNDFPAQPPVCCRDDGVSYGLDGITFPKWRQESIKAYGNAIVPQVAYRIFEAINEYEKFGA